jgi:tetratricopeptide (TPR) repeat protein
MKKSRKIIHTARRSAPSSSGHEAKEEPPAHVINEMVALLDARRFELLEEKAKAAIRHWPGHFFGWKALGILMLMQGKHAEALAPLANNAKLSPNDAQAHQNLGSAFLGLEWFGEAAASFQQALAINPDYVQAHNNLGIALMDLGRLEEAEASYRQALFLKPDFVAAHNNLGNVLMQIGRLAEAEASYRQVLKFSPDYAQAHSGLGTVLLKLGRLADAIACYRKALGIDASLLQAQDGLNQALSRLTPMWHVPMMNDRIRNDAYFVALSAAITPDTHVLEIGTGSGLLAMMAAKLGARQVTTCEAVPEIAETARAIVADNGLTPPVTVVSKVSTEMKIDVDMADRADLLVSEILSSEFLGEGVLSSIVDAKQRLLQPGARIIPARGSIQFALFGGVDIRRNVRVDEVYGFDLSKFNTIVPPKQYISRNDLNIDLLTDDTCAFFFDFIDMCRIPPHARKTIELPVRKAGRCCGIIQWLRLEMDDTVVFENHPSLKNPASGWEHCVYVFPAPIDMLPGQVAMVSAAHNRITPWFFLEGMK